jgi:hypothetical protein
MDLEKFLTMALGLLIDAASVFSQAATDASS